ncbi:acyl-CoA dehydrogenase family protein [Streptomyces sp. ST2-7A]|uniref:acyl-CoA dehydrogenase family protein n=1 Tax=Streptomyces sp. ST2-7A TaxID=2907214 RepID=UPI001F3DE7DB|nr:acyl-CoA dehydrogenase family protein [Streptomyces sp. ST2-7A]MCE7079478.1 acyl-CoA dehydrogenase family protein [Streptomyces sp. ST2-7A]
MTTVDIPTRAQLVRRATDLVPLLRSGADRAQRDGRLSDDTVEALTEAGAYRLRVPRRYGGHEVDTRTLVEFATELARGDGSAAWSASVTWIPTYMACMFPDEVQDEVFSTPDVRLCGTLSPSAQAVPASGGITVNGGWGFVSGAPHAHWQQILAVLIDGDKPPMPVMALVPMNELKIVDDWDSHGLRGTGSVTTVAENVFVPRERILPLPAVLAGQYASVANKESAVYRAPLLPVASASSVGTAVGLAMAARDLFMERLPERGLTYTSYGTQAEAAQTHLKVAEAHLLADEAVFHAHRLADQVDAKSGAGEEWSAAERSRARADLGAAVRRAGEAVDILAGASGGSSVYRRVPIQRILADINAVALHALMNPDVNTELYGRVLCGLEPNTQYL